MEQSHKLTPSFFFLSIGSLAALITTVVAFLNLSFELFNGTFPDVLTDTYYYGYASYNYEAMRVPLALLIIVFPVYLVLEHYWQRVSLTERTHWNQTIKRWAIYLILFLASVVVIVDLVILVRYFVSGEITLRFIFKVLVTLVTAKLVGYYYLRKLRYDTDKKKIWFTIASIALVIAAIIWSFAQMGAPGSQRKLRIDQRRVDDLQSIQGQVIYYWQQTQTLPESLMDLSSPISSYMVPRDPEFAKGLEYEYTKTGEKSFSLCATFSLPMPEGWVSGGGRGYGFAGRDVAMTSMPYPGNSANNNWDHEVGRTCYDREIDERLYPPFEKAEPIIR